MGVIDVSHLTQFDTPFDSLFFDISQNYDNISCSLTRRFYMEEIKVIGPNAAKISGSLKFLQWVRQLNPNLQLHKIYEEWSCFSPGGELIFALFYIAGRFVFFRPDAVAVFLVVSDKTTRQKYIVLVEQLRIPTGSKLLEIPAGTIEDNGDPLGTAVREIREEVGLEIAADNLKLLGTYYLSPGASNEKITLFYCEIKLSRSEIDSLKNRLAGLQEEGEKTQVKLIPFREFKNLAVNDAKTRLAYELYCRRRTNES